MPTFRQRLIATLRAARPVLEVDGVLVAGSEVPNLLERGAASTPPSELDDGFRVPVPRNAGLLLEKLVTERSGIKGDRDLLVALGLLMVAEPADIDELGGAYARLPADLKQTVRSNLTILTLLERLPDMPNPTQERARVGALLERLERSA